jgi:hypothetical protein
MGMPTGTNWNTPENTEPDNAPNGYITQMVVCSWCEYSHISVHPYGVFEVECPKCSLMFRVSMMRFKFCAAGHAKIKRRRRVWVDPHFVLLPASKEERERD